MSATSVDISQFSMCMQMKSIILGGGCFWCIEPIFQEINGVLSVHSGYAGGFDENPTYKSVCAGVTGHTEVVKVEYDADVISLAQILQVFFTLHNPTTLNRQGNDVGTQYRSAVYYNDDKELAIIENAIAEAEELWSLPVVTEVKKDIKYYPGEAYHQNYYNLNPNQGYCSYVISPKLSKLRKTFTALLKSLIIILMSFVGLQAQSIILEDTLPPTDPVEGVPILSVNFYLLDYTGFVDTIISSQIEHNIAFLNQEYEGKVKFVQGTTVKDGGKVYLPEIYDDFYASDGEVIKNFTERLELQGGVNIYICRTYLDEDGTAELLGFTPVLKAKQYAYKLNTPRFDRIFMSYSGLNDKTTIVHEMGHFLGLHHPWRLHPINLELQGLTSEKIIEDNHMSYSDSVHEFTAEQLDRMQHFALQFRRYLCADIELSQP